MIVTGAETMPDLADLTGAASQRAQELGHPVLLTVGVPTSTEVALPDAPVAGLWIEPGLSVAGAGQAVSASRIGTDRLQALAAATRSFLHGALGEGAEPFAFAGASFADGDDSWPGFPEAVAWVPEIAVVRDASGTRLVATVSVGGEEGEAAERLRELLDEGLPAPREGGVDAVPYGTYTPDDETFEDNVRAALSAIEEGGFDKVVLARRMRLRSSAGVSPASLAEALARRYPTCFTYGFRRGDAAFVGASPELLVAREGSVVRATPAAGTVADSSRASESRKLAGGLDTPKSRWEQELVADAVYDALEPLCDAVSTHLPMVVSAGPVQHLATAVEGNLREPVHVLDLVAALHPTPAVGGVPADRALGFIAEHEGFERGWYAGPVGVVRADGSGAFAVALRGALLRGSDVDLFAGAGIVEGSVPREERREIELKLGAVAAALIPER